MAVQPVSADDEVESYEVRALAVERLTFFADAVIAIAITLLALDLPVPTGTTNAEVLRFAADHREEYLAFLISFAVIGAVWRAHHRVFRYATALGGGLVRLTMFWLLMQVITPFATRVLTGDGAFQVRFIFYALIEVTSATLFLLMVRDLRRYKLTREDTPPNLLSDARWRSATLATGFLVSIPVSFIGEAPAFACWIVIPFAMGLIGQVIRYQRARSHSSASRP